MSDFTRRDVLKIGAGAAAGAMVADGIGATPALAQSAPQWTLAPEKGAALRVLRPSKFVQGDETLWLENSKKYTQQTGINVRVDSVSWEDLRPKAAVSANIGQGPDIIYGWYDDAHNYPEKLVEVTDVADYLGAKYGGWYDSARKYGTKDGKWISIPLGASGAKIVYRQSWVREAGFDGVPTDLAGFLKLCQGLKKNNHPAGFALGNAVGDANGWCHWVVWTHGGRLIDDNDKVILDSPETVAALEYAKQLYETFIPGTLSWQDPSNNKAFLAGEISLTSNGISIYYAAKTSEDPAQKALAADIFHAPYPIGPVGKPTQANLIVPAMIYKYSKQPNAAKDYIRFMMEREQYEPWQQDCIGYWSHPLEAYSKTKVWTEDPKHTPYRDVMKESLWTGYSGSLGYASAAVLADFVMVNMVASVCVGDKTPKQAIADAVKRTERYYKT
jgi:multiple sugar transport system substrate-binding protein